MFVSYSSFTYYTIANVFHEYADYISYLRFDGFATSPFTISRKWIFYTPYTAWSIHRRPCGSATFRGWAQQPPCLSVRTGMQMMRRGPGAASWVPARHPIRIPIYSRTESLSLSLSRPSRDTRFYHPIKWKCLRCWHAKHGRGET